MEEEVKLKEWAHSARDTSVSREVVCNTVRLDRLS